MGNNNISKFTLNSIKSPKLMLTISCFITILIDIIATFMLYQFNYDIQYVLIPTIMVALDIVFLVVATNSNYRYKYTIMQFVSYILLTLALVAGIVVIGGTFSTFVIMTTLSLILWVGSHIMVVISTLITSLHAAKVTKGTSKIGSLVSIFLLSMIGVVTTYSVVSNGFFGQGIIEENKTIVYEYIGESDAYSVKSTLKGRGNTINIPNEFNGKEVLFIDGEVLTDSSLKVVRFEKRSKPIEFKNFDLLEERDTEGLTFYADKDDINEIRQSVLSLKNDNVVLTNTILNVINNMYPEALEANEVYVSFNYSDETLEIANNKVLDVWFGQKGDTFTFEYASDIEYANYSDLTSIDDLHWGYEHNNRYIMNQLIDDKGNAINGLTIQDSIDNVEVSFKRIYKVIMENDNDDKYEIDDVYRTSELSNGDVLNFKYVLENNCDDVINSVPLRDGFTLSWKDDKGVITSLKSLLNDDIDTVYIHPVWNLNAPTITHIATSNNNNTFTYGDSIVYSAEATHENPGIQLEYQWINYDRTGNSITVNNVYPSDAGEKQLVVKAYSDTITSLISTATDNINITVNKKVLNFDWSLDSNMVYDGRAKVITYQWDDTQVINSDIIDVDYIYNDAINAGTYQRSIELIGDAATKYYIPTEDKTFTFEIERKLINVTWESDPNYTYDSFEKSISLSAINGLVAGDNIDSQLHYSGANKNVGTHTMSVTIDSSSNYRLEGDISSSTYTIKPKKLIINFEDLYTEYNGKTTSSSLFPYEIDANNGLAYNDLLNEVLTFKFNGGAISAKNVGDYEYGAYYTLNSKGANYDIVINDAMLNITKRDLGEARWTENRNLVYNASEQGIYVEGFDNVVSGDEQSVINSLEYVGYGVDVGQYSMTVSLKSGTTAFQNYELSSAIMTYNIVKANLNITASSLTKTYDGEVFAEFGYHYQGLQGDDTIDEVVEISYSGNAINAKDAGVYNVELVLSEGYKYNNYNIIVTNGKLTINKRSVAVEWQSERTFTYDGTYHSIEAIGGSNIVVGETSLFLSQLSYSGDNVNAGTHDMICTISSDSNYVITNSTCKYTIDKANLNITAYDITKTYDGKTFTVNDASYDYNGLVGSDSLSEVATVSFSGNAIGAKNARVDNPYEIRLTLSAQAKYSNYDIKLTHGKLTINKRALTAFWEDDYGYVYNGTAQGYRIESLYNCVAGEESAVLNSITYSGIGTNAGFHTIVASLPSDSNYYVDNTFTFDYEISKATLIFDVDNQSKVYDGQVFTNFTYKVINLGKGDSINDVTANIVFEGDAVSAIDVGDNYEITLTATILDTANYNSIFEVEPGKLVISKRSVNLTWDYTSAYYYDGNVHQPKVNGASNLPDGASIEDLNITYSGDVNKVDAGTYSISAIANNPNYSATSTKSYTISPATLTINIKNITYEYDGNANYVLTYEVKNIVPGDVESEIVSISLYIQGQDTNPTEVGTYTITAIVSILNDNYTYAVKNGTLTIVEPQVEEVFGRTYYQSFVAQY